LEEFDFPAAPQIPVPDKKLSEGEYLERKNR